MAFCNQCGAELVEGSEFCHHCGAKAYTPGFPDRVDVTPAQTTAQAQPLVSTVSPSKVLAFGIVGLALSELPWGGSIVGIVFSHLAKKMADTFEEEHGMIFGQAKVGRILGKIGFIVSIVMTVVWTLLYFLYGMIIAGMISDIFTSNTIPVYFD